MLRGKGNTAEAAAWLSGTLTGRAVQGPLPALAFFPDTLLPLFCEENLSSMPGLPLPGLSLMTHALSVPQLYHKQAQLCHIPSGRKQQLQAAPPLVFRPLDKNPQRPWPKALWTIFLRNPKMTKTICLFFTRTRRGGRGVSDTPFHIQGTLNLLAPGATP